MLDINDVLAPARDTVTKSPEPEALRVGVTAGYKATTSEGSSTPVNRWVIVNSGDESQVAPVREESDHMRDIHNGHGGSSTAYNLPIHLPSPVRQTAHDLRKNSDSTEEESQMPNLATVDMQAGSTAVFREERFPQEVPTKNEEASGAQARRCLSVDSDSESTEESVLVKSRRKHLTKVKNRSRQSGRSTANPYNLPRSATLRTTAVVV